MPRYRTRKTRTTIVIILIIIINYCQICYALTWPESIKFQLFEAVQQLRKRFEQVAPARIAADRHKEVEKEVLLILIIIKFVTQ